MDPVQNILKSFFFPLINLSHIMPQQKDTKSTYMTQTNQEAAKPIFTQIRIFFPHGHLKSLIFYSHKRSNLILTIFSNNLKPLNLCVFHKYNLQNESFITQKYLEAFSM